MCEYKYGMTIHCKIYWNNMNKLIENIHNGLPSYNLVWCNNEQKEEVIPISAGDD